MLCSAYRKQSFLKNLNGELTAACSLENVKLQAGSACPCRRSCINGHGLANNEAFTGVFASLPKFWAILLVSGHVHLVGG